MTPLEAALIERFAHLGHVYPDDVIVREVVRQMEWVRDQCSEQIGGAAEDSDERVWDIKLTAAPDDWKPR